MAKKPLAFGKQYEKTLESKCKLVDGFWIYRFSDDDRFQYRAQPGDILILGNDYNFLWEVKTTKYDYLPKSYVRDGQLKSLCNYERRVIRNYAFIVIYYTKFNYLIAIPIRNWITAPPQVNLSVAMSLGIVIDDLTSFLKHGYKKIVPCAIESLQL